MKIKIIYGPPGTGKTTRLLSILEKELETYKKNKIAFVSFTKEGSHQGKKRAIEKFGGKEDDYPYFRTLHSLAFKELELSRNMVINKNHYKEFSKKMGMYFTGYYTEDLKHNDDKYLFLADLHRNNPKQTKKYIDTIDIEKYNFVKHNFKKYKEHYNIIDYTDMVKNFVDKNIKVPVKVAIIDEAQDLTSLQWQMVWIAFANCDKVYIAGDDDQSIYEWSGADVDYFLNLKGDIEILKQSYRLPSTILDFSKNITSLISKRVKKDYKPTDKKGTLNHVLKLDELNINKGESWLFLSRNNCYLKNIEEYLMTKGLPYKYKGKQRITTVELNLVRLYEKVRKTRIMSYDEEVKLTPVLNKSYNLNNPWYSSFNWDNEKLSHFRDFFSNKINIDEYDIRVNTIHTVKGSESDNVVLLMSLSKQVYKNLQTNPDSEHRVFYVGVTRAKKNLYIVYGDDRYQYPIYYNKGA